MLIPTTRGAYSRTIQFSVPIDERQRSLVLWAYGSTGAVSDGVLALEPHMLTGLRMGWYTRTVSAERDPAYQEWFLEHHRTSERELEMQRKRYFEVRPVFSIIVPLYKTPLDYFHEMVESVLNQTYGRFELILVNASPENEKLSSAVDAYVERDSRVRRVDIAENLGITLNTNEGIKVATGDFVAFFDHDDILEPDILYRYAQGINDYPDTDLLYCDEDKYIEGKYEAPHLKPDWNPDLLCGCNYVTHMLTVRKSVLDTLELPGKEFDGAQDYHMTFRIAEKARNVFHARKVLYHWRVHPGSTAAASDAKPYTAIAGLRAVQAHLDRTGIDGTACHAKLANYYYIDYHFDEPPLVSIVIPNKDMAPVLTDCVDSILHKTDYANYEVVIVENGSVEPETFACYEELQKDERVRVVAFDTGGEFNFSKIINFGFNEAKGDYLLMLNNDTKVIEPAWLRSMMGIAQREDVGAVGAKLVYPDMTIQHAGVTVNRSNPLHIGEKLPYDAVDFFNYLNMTCDLVAVTGACLLTKRPVFEKVGGMDESFASDYNDVDFCLKMVAEGLRVVYDPQAFLFHYESLSRDVGESSERQLLRVREASRLQQKWPAYWALGDPFLSLNFRAGGQYRQLGW